MLRGPECNPCRAGWSILCRRDAGVRQGPWYATPFAGSFNGGYSVGFGHRQQLCGDDEIRVVMHRLIESGLMRYAFECPVEGKVKLPDGARRMAWFGKDLTFGCDEDGTLKTIRIEAPVSEDETISQVSTLGPDGRITGLVARGGEKIHKELLEDLQALESAFGFYLNLSRIRREFMTGIAVPETPEEQARIEWNNMRFTREIRDDYSEVTLDHFKGILEMAHICRPLAATMAFFREGEMT